MDLPSLTLSLNTHWVLILTRLMGFSHDKSDEKWQTEWKTQAIAAGISMTWVLGEKSSLQLYVEGRNVVIAPFAFDEEPWS